MRINLLSSVNNYTKTNNQMPVQKYSSHMNFKRLEKDITDFTNSKEDVKNYVKTMFTYYPESPDNINNNFEIKMSKEGLDSFKLKKSYMGYPPEINFFGSMKKQLEYLSKNKISFDYYTNDSSFVIRYKENKLDYTVTYSKKDTKLEYALVNNNTDVHKYDVNPMQASLELEKYGYSFAFSNENRNSLCAPIFQKSSVIKFNKNMDVTKTTSETTYNSNKITEEALFNKDGSVIRYNKSQNSRH